MERSGTVDKALRVLEVLHQAGAPLTLAELSRALAIPKPTTHRLLSSLLNAALVEQNQEGRYALGMGLVRLGLGALGQDPLVRACELELERAARELGETFFLVKARAGRLLVLSKVEGTGMLRVAPEVGSEVPVELTASGRLYAAFAPERLAGNPGLERVSAAAVKRARARGYDLNEAEWLPGLSVVAAPIFLNRDLLGCVTCAGPAVRMDAARLKQAIATTRELAERVSRSLGTNARAARAPGSEE